MKNIDTLVEDIYEVAGGGIRVQPELTKLLADKLATRLANRVEEERAGGKLRLSQISHPCDRKIWYDINQPELAEKLSPETHIKFAYGDILEEFILFLAKVAGHDVQDEQREVNLHGIPGHLDAIIDGHLVDCKSASTFAWYKFASHLSLSDDGFGYLGQGDAYLEASQDNPRLEDKHHYSFLAVDKQLGKLVLDTHPRLGVNWELRIEDLKRTVSNRQPPPRSFAAVADGASGNQKLDTVCSYCVHKRQCWPGLRGYSYSNGPRFLTRTAREPDVPRLF